MRQRHPPLTVRVAAVAIAGAIAVLAPSAHAQVGLHAVKGPAGTVLVWSGGVAPYDAIRTDLSALVEGATAIDLGPATRIECGSADVTTAGGAEDPALPLPGEVFLYHVRGTSYGTSSGGKELVPAAGTDCPAPGGSRTETEVCNRWNADYPEQSTDVWSGPTSGCNQGTVDPVATEDGVRRTNLYRWLVGLPPMVENPTYSSKVQAAVVIMRGRGSLTHAPAPSDPCYTAAGDEGAGSSNLGAGFASLAASVDAYIGDSGVSSLGHRRWLLHPAYAEGGFGIVEGGSYGFWSGQWVFGFGADPAPAFVAYPAPGPFPLGALRGHWSFAIDRASFASATVRVVRLGDNRDMTVSGVYQPANGYGLNTLAWDVAGVAAGQDFEVTIDGVGAAPQSTYVYVTRLASCP
jgi:hypothetical protein